MRLFTKLKNIIVHPSIIGNKIRGVIRHLNYPNINSSAIIIKPLVFTPRFITLGKRVFILNNARIEGVGNYAGTVYTPHIVIGDGTTIQQNCHITCADSVAIGSHCAITHNVTITDIDHSYEYEPSNYPPHR